jgi:pyruvate dehydrogenase phosphatase
MYAQRMVSLTAATSLENLRALNEVRDFATTDMGLGGPELWTYRILQEPGLSTELQRLANPLSVGGVDAIDFQPCQLHEFRTQDRKCIEHWQMPSGGLGGPPGGGTGTWVFTAIFDGQCIRSAASGAEVLEVAGVLSCYDCAWRQDTPGTPPWSTRFGRSPP